MISRCYSYFRLRWNSPLRFPYVDSGVLVYIYMCIIVSLPPLCIPNQLRTTALYTYLVPFSKKNSAKDLRSVDANILGSYAEIIYEFFFLA